MGSVSIETSQQTDAESTFFSGSSGAENKLDFSNINILGREDEISRLQEVYSHVQLGGSSRKIIKGSENHTSIVMIRGLAGTGKSTLVKQFMEDIERRSRFPGGPIKPFFLYGKFDDLSADDPFSAIVDAFSDFANMLLEGGDEELERVRKDINDALGEEANYLTTIIPGLRNIMESTNEDDDKYLGSKENASNRLKYVFQKFTNAISSKTRPLVMVLDDLHCGDKASAELIQALLTDNDLRHLMFIGTYQSDLMTKKSPFHSCFRIIDNSQRIKKIKLINLSIEEMGSFISDALNVDDVKEADTLVKMVYDKTKGNIFYAKQILDELYRKGFLELSPTTGKWEWHLDDGDLDAILSDDVFQAVTAKLQSASEKLQKALTIAAYTRSTIDLDVLQTLMKLDGCPVESKVLVKILDRAVLDGLLLNSMGSKSYSFANDRIQQAAYGLVPSGPKRDNYRLVMGKRLYDLGHTDGAEDWMLYAAADHLNSVRSFLEDPLFLIKLNLEAGDRAASRAAFETASKYLGFALQDLLHTNDPWERHYNITLKVYQTIVDVKLCQGHLSVGKTIGDEVLKKAKTNEDKIPTQLALSKALGREEKHQESFEMSVTTLQLLKEYPRRTVSLHAGLVKDLMFVKRYFKKNSNEDILKLPLMRDKKKEFIMAFLSSSAYQAFYCGNMVEFLVGTLRMIRISIKYGLCGQSGVAFTGYCLFCNNINDMEGATRFSGLARKVLQVTKAKHLEALQLFVVEHWINAWKNPHQDVLDMYEYAHKAGMETGDFENGLLSRTAGYHHEFAAGYPLSPLSAKFSNLVLVLKNYKIDAVCGMTMEQWFVVRYLTGNTTTSFKSFEAQTGDSSDTYRLVYGYLARLQLAVYFGDYDFAEKMVEKLTPISEFDKSHSVNSLRLFFSSLAYTTLARKSKKKIYESKARKFCDQLISLCKVKGSNSLHRCTLMEAHLKSLGGKKSALVQSSYDHAIAEALKKGQKQDAALAAQLAAEHFLSIGDDVLSSVLLTKARDLLVKKYLTEARDLFREWGAKTLVAHLEQIYSKHINPSANQSERTAPLEESLADIEMVGASDVSISQNSGRNDEVSVLSGLSAWKSNKSASNSHFDGNSFPSLFEQYEEIASMGDGGSFQSLFEQYESIASLEDH